MVKCKDCGKEMYPVILIDGRFYLRDTSCYDINTYCHDCGILNKEGNIHHFGCDVERCPKCRKQLISCSCEKQRLYLFIPIQIKL